MDYKNLTQKKQRLDAHGLSQETQKSLEEWFCVELTYTSNALEGNTLTRQETALVLEKGFTSGSKALVEYLEARNHAAAFEWVRDQPLESGSEKGILTIHSLILKGIDDTHAGRYRGVAVRIAGSPVVLPNPLKVPFLMEAFTTWLASPPELHPVEFAALAHHQLVSIHPFIDGNGRTARLLMNGILMGHGYPPVIIRKRDRIPYLKALEKAQLGGSLETYYDLIYKGIMRSFDIYFETVAAEPIQPQKQPLLRIGEVAQAVGEPVSTIRYWTQQRLIEIASHTEAGYGLYAKETIDTIDRIRRLKGERYSLDEIRRKIKE